MEQTAPTAAISGSVHPGRTPGPQAYRAGHAIQFLEENLAMNDHSPSPENVGGRR